MDNRLDRAGRRATDALVAIDRALDGRCPCGARPAPGSAYCGADCTPTHIAVHTDRRETGDLATPMRWRPDLVDAVDDNDHARGSAPLMKHDPGALGATAARATTPGSVPL